MRSPDAAKSAGSAETEQAATSTSTLPVPADIPPCPLCPLPSCGLPPCRRDPVDVPGVCRITDVFCDVVVHLHREDLEAAA